MTRIVGGRAGGRRLRTPSGGRTRPTGERVREALFSSLEARLGPMAGLRVLDLYAGSGAVGLEAASRGASTVRSVESDRRTAALVRRNAADLGLRAVEVLGTTVARALEERPEEGYDVVFADPPYAVENAEVERILQRLAAGWLAPGGLVVLERSSRDAPPAWPEAWECWQSRRYGETVLWYLREDRGTLRAPAPGR